jgi:3-hydroxyacyl-CoA dehydrogenase/enoyl-CoA hydratase/3-hydroxybutyryl-CoA epimerase
MDPTRAETFRFDERPDGVALLRIDVPGQTHNVLNKQLRTELSTVLDYVAARDGIKLLVIRSDKKAGFLAGADIHEFAYITGPDEAHNASAEGQTLFDKLAGLRVPTIAMIHGPCLGGGLELALACDYRLMVDDSKTQIGFPEIELGLLPAWGGTQRLPRLVGLERALRVILSRKRLSAKEAKRWRLADATASTEDQLAVQLRRLIDLALRTGKKTAKGRPLRTWRQMLLESNPLGRLLLFRGTERILRRHIAEDMPAPFEALAAIREGWRHGVAVGLAREREAAALLSTTPSSRNLVELFLRMEEARHSPESVAPDSVPPLRRVGIVGAGVMGAGIAQLAALRGFEVVVQEVNQAALDAGMDRIADLFSKAVKKQLVSAQKAEQCRTSIRGSTVWQGFDDVDLVIEAAVEDLPVKKRIFRDLQAKTASTTILATNTSSLLVSDLRSEVSNSKRLAGLHFFNPVHKMPLVEVVSTHTTDDRTMQLLRDWTIRIGKIPVLVHDGPGFVVNRILMPYLDEATRLVAEGIPINQIDHTMRRFGMPMGPLELLDQVGLDVAAHVADAMRPVVKDRFPGNDTFRRLVERGWLGQKSGMGFYRYRGKAKKVNPNAADAVVAAAPHEPGGVSESLPMAVRIQEGRERMVLLMVNEAAMCLDERLAANVATIDLAMVLGTGWAPHRGGPLTYALDRGVDRVRATLQGLAGRHGRRFEPSAGLVHLSTVAAPTPHVV